MKKYGSNYINNEHPKLYSSNNTIEVDHLIIILMATHRL